MKKNILSIILFLIFTSQAISHTVHYENINLLEYELFRNNKSIGYHNYKFERKNNSTEVKSTIEFKIRKLGIDLYVYEAVSTEKYKENQPAYTEYLTNKKLLAADLGKVSSGKLNIVQVLGMSGGSKIKKDEKLVKSADRIR